MVIIGDEVSVKIIRNMNCWATSKYNDPGVSNKNKLMIYGTNKIGPRTAPCGTPKT